MEDVETAVTFKELGICDESIKACQRLGWTSPSEIQAQVIPQALQGIENPLSEIRTGKLVEDLDALAGTISYKVVQKNDTRLGNAFALGHGIDLIAIGPTASDPRKRIVAFALPILQALFENLQHPPFFACVLAPTSELAFEIGDLFTALGSTINLKCAVVAEGVDMTTAFAKNPHIVVLTPACLMDLLSNPISYQNLIKSKYLVLDEADKLLSNEFEKMVYQIMARISFKQRIYLFSATLTNPVLKFKITHLRNPVTIKAVSECSIIDTLNQEYCPTLQNDKECHLVYILTNIAAGSTSLIFTGTCESIPLIASILREIGFEAVSISELMTWSERLDSLATCKAEDCKILVCTDEGSTGLDIPSVDVVINYDIPTDPKGYIDRVGKTAREGKAITLVSNDELECYLRVEVLIEKELAQYHAPHDEVMKYLGRIARVKDIMKEMTMKKYLSNTRSKDKNGNKKMRGKKKSVFGRA